MRRDVPTSSTVVCRFRRKPVRLVEDSLSGYGRTSYTQSLDCELFEFLGLIFQISPTIRFFQNRSPTVRHSAINSLRSLWPDPLDIRGKRMRCLYYVRYKGKENEVFSLLPLFRPCGEISQCSQYKNKKIYTLR